MKRALEICGIITKKNLAFIIGASEREEKKCSARKIFEEIMVGNIPNLTKELYLQIQEVQ